MAKAKMKKNLEVWASVDLRCHACGDTYRYTGYLNPNVHVEREMIKSFQMSHKHCEKTPRGELLKEAVGRLKVCK